YAKKLETSLSIDEAEVEAAAHEMLAPFEEKGDENPYTIHHDLQDCMQDNVGIIRTEKEVQKALGVIKTLKERLGRVKIDGNRQFSRGWRGAMDLRSMLWVSEAVALAALERKESRGGHTREDHPKTDAHFAKVNVVLKKKGDDLEVRQEPLPEMPP